MCAPCAWRLVRMGKRPTALLYMPPKRAFACVGVSVRASLSLGCEEAPLGGASEEYLTELTVELVKAVF